ncbi:hypothetical protein EDC14_100928 [Hydrogenispora ethanolica]|uniref:Uncharacterized protein n=1 Tax=Hydrogenispora ethanolica TaxID=1082276 RepID=A0A4R1RVN7_HYDET|nr:hypothetical protein EDC14_100928 [Hydrogenispora ethanolica]
MGLLQMTDGWQSEWSQKGLDINRCTCLTCYNTKRCEYAFETYNQDGECLWCQMQW